MLDDNSDNFDSRNLILLVFMTKNKLDLYMSVLCRLQTYAPVGQLNKELHIKRFF